MDDLCGTGSGGPMSYGRAARDPSRAGAVWDGADRVRQLGCDPALVRHIKRRATGCVGCWLLDGADGPNVGSAPLAQPADDAEHR